MISVSSRVWVKKIGKYEQKYNYLEDKRLY